MSGNFTKSLLAALEDNLVAERFRLILQPAIDSVTDSLKQTIGDLQQAVGVLQDTVKTKNAEIAALRKEVHSLRDHADALEQHSRRGSVRVFGIPENTPGTTDQKLLHLFNEKMQIKPPIHLDDIEVSHHVGRLRTIGPQPQVPQVVKPRPIIVKFLSRRTKARVMAARKRLREDTPGRDESSDDEEAEVDDDGTNPVVEEGGETPVPGSLPRTLYPYQVYISDDLTSSRAKIAYRARGLKRDNKIKDTWIFDCQIMIKDNENLIHKVNDMRDLDNFSRRN